MGKYVIEQKMNEIQARYNSKRLTIKMPIYSPKSWDLTNQNREREREVKQLGKPTDKG